MQQILNFYVYTLIKLGEIEFLFLEVYCLMPMRNRFTNLTIACEVWLLEEVGWGLVLRVYAL